MALKRAVGLEILVLSYKMRSYEADADFVVPSLLFPIKGEISWNGDHGLGERSIYLDEVYLVTALVPSETACLANSPGKRSLTAV